jgi:hypothetical protein
VKDPLTSNTSYTAGIAEFWYGSAERWSALMLERVMLSYNAIRRLRTPWSLPGRVMEDSGAFAVILKNGDYPWSPKEYANHLELWSPEIAWTMDYPCEPGVRAAGGYTVAEAQAKTNANTMALRDLGADVQSVVQGWEPAEYIAHVDALRSEGLLTPRLGIGSVCRRGHTADVVRVIRAIRANTPGWVKLHAFGIKADVLRSEARFWIYSADSSAWRIRAFGYFGSAGISTTERRTRRIPEKAAVLREYVSRMEGLLAPRDPLGEVGVVV